MVRALVLSEHDLGAWAAGYRAGERPAPLPYGVDRLGALGWTLTGSRTSRSAPARRARDVVEHRTGLALDRTLHGFGEARRADVVLALLETQGMFAAALKQRHVPPWSRRPLVLWTCWLGDVLQRADRETRARLARRLAAVDLITHMSRHEAEIYRDLGIPAERLLAITFGVSEDFYRPDPALERDLEVLAVGQDRGRDYATLLDAVRGTDVRVHLVCRPANLAGLDVPPNVTVAEPVPLPEYRRLLQRARVVAVPTHELAYPTGQSVALEAAAAGCCVAVTGTRAMSDYLTDETALLVPVGDPDGWRDALIRALGDDGLRDRLGRAARASVETTYNATTTWRELDHALRERGIVR